MATSVDKLVAVKVKSQAMKKSKNMDSEIATKEPEKEKTQLMERWEFDFTNLKLPDKSKDEANKPQMEDTHVKNMGFHKIYINFIHKGIPIIFAFKKAENCDLFVGKLGKEGIE